MPVMLLEVMGLALDNDFGFTWTVTCIRPFDLENVVHYPPMVMDVDGFYLPAN